MTRKRHRTRIGSAAWRLLILATLFAPLLAACSDDAPRQRAAARLAPPPAEPEPAVDPYQQIEGLPHPTPDREPEQVVRLVVQAMGDNDNPIPDAGIKTAYNFASPPNKRMTGPVERFIAMVHTPAYQPLLDFQSAEYSPLQVRGDHARQAVELTTPDGRKTIYLFNLSRQPDGPFKNCWMTDAVQPLTQRPPPPDHSQNKPRNSPKKPL